MNIRKILVGILAITTLSFTGCGSKTEVATEGENTVVKLGVVGSVYEDLWKPAKDKLLQEGVDLQIVQFSDYTTPNNALNSGDIDLNAFQHKIYLEAEVESYGYEIQPIGYTFIIPLNLYSSKITSIKDIKDGDTVAIPNDTTNGGRALKVLESAGLIKLKEDTLQNPTKKDIQAYSKAIEIKELAANTIPSTLQDVTAAIINGNYALDFGLKTQEAIYKDNGLEDSNYWCLVAARSEDLKDNSRLETYKKVIKAFQSNETEKVFNDVYGGYFIKVGWEQDLIK